MRTFISDDLLLLLLINYSVYCPDGSLNQMEIIFKSQQRLNHVPSFHLRFESFWTKLPSTIITKRNELQTVKKYLDGCVIYSLPVLRFQIYIWFLFSDKPMSKSSLSNLNSWAWDGMIYTPGTFLSYLLVLRSYIYTDWYMLELPAIPRSAVTSPNRNTLFHLKHR